MHFDDMKIGMEMETAPAIIEKEKMMEFARLYDTFPLHTDEDYAKKSIFGQLVAPGVMSFMSVWVKFLELGVLGDEFICGKSTKIEWIKPVFAGDILTGKAVVTDLVRRNEKNGMVVLRIDVYNQDGVLVLVDVTEAILKCRPKGSLK